MALSKEKRKLLDRLGSPRMRGKAGAFLVEGIRGAQEFLHATLPLEISFALHSPRLLELGGGPGVAEALAGSGIPVEELTDEELRSLSATENPQGVILVVKEPAGDTPSRDGLSNPRILVLDGIQDPGNVGTLVRSARAFGLGLVLALDGCADPWGAKAVRGSAGALAHLPVQRMPWTQAQAWLEKLEIPILVAAAHGKPVDWTSAPPAWALAVGNEGAGVREELLASSRGSVSIPMAPGVESLNVAVAGSVLLYALTSFADNSGERE